MYDCTSDLLLKLCRLSFIFIFLYLHIFKANSLCFVCIVSGDRSQSETAEPTRVMDVPPQLPAPPINTQPKIETLTAENTNTTHRSASEVRQQYENAFGEIIMSLFR